MRRARKRHICAHCGRRIEIGSPVSWDRHAKGVYYHPVCDADPARTESHKIIKALLGALEDGKDVTVTINLAHS